ncbi:MAG: hypothetical protein WCS85_04515 [Candidatus Peribacteraceae bacterium]
MIAVDGHPSPYTPDEIRMLNRAKGHIIPPEALTIVEDRPRNECEAELRSACERRNHISVLREKFADVF